MKYIDLKATHENIVETFVNDSIGRNVDICRFIVLLNSLDRACSIALNAAWGSGKTFFVKQVKMILDNSILLREVDEPTAESERINTAWAKVQKGNPAELKKQLCVYYDAWENDQDSDPMLSLIYSIVQNVHNVPSFQGDTSLVGLIEKAGPIIDFFAPKAISASVQAAGNIVQELKGEDILKEISKGKDIDRKIEAFFNDLIVERAERLVIIIDELDRCKPDYAVKLLERIKHYCSDERITFVFAINQGELQHTISKFYGNSFDSCKYLDRFFDLQLELPQADMDRFYQFIDFDDSTYAVDKVCEEIVSMLNMEMRDSIRYLNLVRVAVYEPTHNRSNRSIFNDEITSSFCFMYVVPLIIGLKGHNSAAYKRFIDGEDGSFFVDLIKRMTNKHGYDFNCLLMDAEVFGDEKNNDDARIVSLEGKVGDVYAALFRSASNPNDRVSIGKIRIDEHIRDAVRRSVTLLSNYAIYE